MSVVFNVFSEISHLYYLFSLVLHIQIGSNPIIFLSRICSMCFRLLCVLIRCIYILGLYIRIFLLQPVFVCCLAVSLSRNLLSVVVYSVMNHFLRSMSSRVREYASISRCSTLSQRRHTVSLTMLYNGFRASEYGSLTAYTSSNVWPWPNILHLNFFIFCFMGLFV